MSCLNKVLIGTFLILSLMLTQPVKADVWPTQWYWYSGDGHTSSTPATVGTHLKWHIVVRGMDNQLYYRKWEYGLAWSSWTSLGGTTHSAPAITNSSAWPATPASNKWLYLIVRGTNNQIYYNRMTVNTQTWSGFYTLGGATKEAPSVIGYHELVSANNVPKTLVVVRGTNNRLYYKECDTGSNMWDSSWGEIGGSTVTRPALAVDFRTVLLAVRGLDGKVYVNTYDGDSWGGWMNLGGQTKSMPAISTVKYFDDGGPPYPYKYRRIVVVRGLDNGLYYKTWCDSETPPTTWTPMSGGTKDAPSLCTDNEKKTHLAVIGNNGISYHRYYHQTKGWSEWKQIGTTSPGYPASPIALTYLQRSSTTQSVAMLCQGLDNKAYWTDLAIIPP